MGKIRRIEDAPSRCIKRLSLQGQESVIPVTLTRYRRFSHGLKRLLSATLRALEDAMGGFRCRLGWCLSPGAVFKTAAPYSGFLMVVVVSVMLVCGLRLPGLLASWLRRSGSGPACVVRSRAFWTGFRGEWYDRRRFVGGFVSGRWSHPLLSQWFKALLAAPCRDRCAFAFQDVSRLAAFEVCSIGKAVVRLSASGKKRRSWLPFTPFVGRGR